MTTPTTTPNLNLTYLAPSQSQPEVPINDAWDKIAAAVNAAAAPAASLTVGTVAAVTQLNISGATVTAGAAGVANVTITPSTTSPPSTGTTSSAASAALTLSGTATVLNVSTAALFLLSLTATTQIGLTGAVDGQATTVVLVVQQAGSTAALLTWSGSIAWAGGVAPTLTTTSGSADVIELRSGDGTHWYGTVLGTNVFAVAPFAGPLSIPNAAYWFDASAQAVAPGSVLTTLPNGVLGRTTLFSVLTGLAGVTQSATLLNGNPVYTWPNSTAGNFVTNDAGVTMNASTTFIVMNAANSSSGYGFDILNSSASGGLEFRYHNGNLALQQSGGGPIASPSTITVADGTWFQMNVLFNGPGSTVGYRAHQTSGGTFATSYTSGADNSFGYDPAYPGLNFNGGVAELIVYERVLTLSEIIAVEGYLHSKWGV